MFIMVSFIENTINIITIIEHPINNITVDVRTDIIHIILSIHTTIIHYSY